MYVCMHADAGAGLPSGGHRHLRHVSADQTRGERPDLDAGLLAAPP